MTGNAGIFVIFIKDLLINYHPLFAFSSSKLRDKDGIGLQSLIWEPFRSIRFFRASITILPSDATFLHCCPSLAALCSQVNLPCLFCVIEYLKMVKQAERSSVFVLVTHFEGPYFGALYEVKLDGRGKEGTATHEIQPVVETVSRFTGNDLGRGMWTFCILGAKLYILPDGGPDFFDKDVCSPKCNGHILDIETGELVCASIKPPAPKWFGTHVSAYGKIYSLSDPYCSSDVPDPSFEEYDPTTMSWKTLCSYPYTDEYGTTEIQGYAVCDEILLFSISSHTDKDGALWAYNVIKNQWFLVQVSNTDSYFRRRAVVVDQTIYALSKLGKAIVTFSIRSNQNEEGKISYSICSFLKLDFPQGIDWRSDQHLVSLSNLVFYLVQSGFDDEVDGCQPLSIIKFQIVGGSKINFISTMHYEVDIQDSGPYHIQLCFLPAYEAFSSSQPPEPSEVVSASFHPAEGSS